MITESVTINSKKAAKLNVLIICGVHGDESYAVKLVNNFKKNLDPKKFSEKIKEEVVKNQIVIDVHNSPNCEPSILIDYDGPNSDEIVWFLKENLINTFMPIIRKSGVLFLI